MLSSTNNDTNQERSDKQGRVKERKRFQRIIQMRILSISVLLMFIVDEKYVRFDLSLIKL